MEDVQVSLVPADRVEEAWPLVWEYIYEAVQQTDGRYELDDAYTLVKEKGYLLWIACTPTEVRGAVITCFLQYPKMKVLHVQFLGGAEGKTWKQAMLAMLRRFADDQGCACIEASGRAGWSRTLKEDGFTPLWHTFELPIAVGA